MLHVQGNMFDHWSDPVVHLPLLKSYIAKTLLPL